MTPPINIDGKSGYGNVTIDGQTVEQITIDGQDVLNTVPDSGDLHARYDLSKNNGSMPISDQTGNGFDLVNGAFSGVSVDINGVQAGDFDGSSDNPHSNTFTTISQPITISAVVEIPGSGTNTFERYLSLNSTSASMLGYRFDNDNWTHFAGNVLSGSNDKSAKLVTVVLDGNNSIHREDGTQINTGSIGSKDMDVLGLAHRRDINAQFWSGKIGEVLIYPDKRSSSEIGDIESYLSTEWAVSI